MKKPIIHTVFQTETFDGYPIQARYNGSLTINVFTGLVEDDEFIDAVEIDVITLSEPGLDNALRAVEAYLDYPDVDEAFFRSAL